MECLIRSCHSMKHSLNVPIRVLLFSEANKWHKFKKVCEFFWGFFLGVLFNRFLIRSLHLPTFIEFSLSLTVCIFLAIGNAISVQIRCISLLVVPSFFGKSGRGVIKGVILSYIIAGPLNNLIKNGNEVVNVFACSASLSYNMTKTKYDLMVQPFQEALLGMNVDLGEIESTSKAVQDIVDVIGKEIEDKPLNRGTLNINKKTMDIEASTKKPEMISENSIETDERYRKKLEGQCEKVISKADEKCRSVFTHGYKNCQDTFSWISALLVCLPLKLGVICNIAEELGGFQMCNASDKVDNGLGENYMHLVNLSKSLDNNLKPANKYFKLDKPKPLIDLHDAHETSKLIVNKLNEKKDVLKYIFEIIDTALSLLFLRVILVSQSYHDDYLTKIEFDNIYVTEYFHKIDERRCKAGKHSLLPLKKVERKKFVDPASFRCIHNEGQRFLSQFVKLILEMITATTFILLDKLFYEALHLVRRHATIEYMQEGLHTMNLEIKGSGMFANLVHSILKGFNIKKTVKSSKTNTQCLPTPSQMSNAILYKIYGGYTVLFFLILLDILTKRMHRMVCAYFYPTREKCRILFIYNEFLLKRRKFLNDIKETVEIIKEEHRLATDHDILRILRTKLPKTFGWLKVFETLNKKCFLCSESELQCGKRRIVFHDCATPDCHFVYCRQCWVDIGQVCYACEESSKISYVYTDSESEEFQSV